MSLHYFEADSEQLTETVGVEATAMLAQEDNFQAIH